MKKTIVIFVALVALALPIQNGRADASKVPSYTLVEAEANPQGEIVSDPTASGGKYVKRDGDYQPLMFAAVPSAGDSFVVWARVKGTSIQLKGVGGDGKQKELNWVYAAPSDFKWESLGRHMRAELDAQALIIRGPDAKNAGCIDCLVFAPDDAFNPDKTIKINN